MARILIGWELGAGLGHVLSMKAMGAALIARGHHVAFALQRVDAMPGGLPETSLLFQSPLWPRLSILAEPVTLKPAVTLIDILARLGLDRPGCLTSMIRAWDGILAGFDPHITITDFAPALLIAAQGRMPTIATGPGFQVPPDDLDPPARLGGAAPGYDEAEMLDLIDADLRDAGREAVPSLSGLFRCSRRAIASFAALDPYGRPAGPDFVAPGIGLWTAPAAVPGDEVFVYVNGPLQRNDALWAGLGATGLPIRAHIPVPDKALHNHIASFGIMVERQPLPWPGIANRSRMAVTHGAHGSMCALMVAGMPQLAIPYDLEKRLHSEALARTGLGRLLADEQGLKPSTVTDAVLAMYGDAAILSHIRSQAPYFGKHMTPDFETSVANLVDNLL